MGPEKRCDLIGAWLRLVTVLSNSIRTYSVQRRGETQVRPVQDERDKVFGGADTHRDSVHVAVADERGVPVADRAFPTTSAGYEAAITWMRDHGRVDVVGVEGTSSYGLGFSAALRAAGVTVVEVDRPDRRSRRRTGNSDHIDAYAAAQAVAVGRATTVPKTNDGPVASIRALHVVRRSAIKARTQAANQIKALLVTAPAHLREALNGAPDLIHACARLRPGPDRHEPVAATKAALRHLARRHQQLDAEVEALDKELRILVMQAAPPALLDLHGVGTDVAATVLIAAGDNPDRMRSEAAFAHLCGAAPIPASSGQRQRHRLNRGGNREANRALYIVAITRMRHHPQTRAFVARRTSEGLSRKEIIRCLKRYIAREIYYILRADTATTSAA